MEENKAAILSHLVEAHASVQAAGDAVDAGDLLGATSYLNDASARQQEAVSLLVSECWQKALRAARNPDARRREEALDELVRLAATLLASLCPQCRQKVGRQLEAGKP